MMLQLGDPVVKQGPTFHPSIFQTLCLLEYISMCIYIYNMHLDIDNTCIYDIYVKGNVCILYVLDQFKAQCSS